MWVMFTKSLCNICRSITRGTECVQEAQPGISDIQDLRGKGNLEKWKRIHQSTSLNSSALHSLTHRHELFWMIPGKTCMNKGTTLSCCKVARELLELKSNCPGLWQLDQYSVGAVDSIAIGFNQNSPFLLNSGSVSLLILPLAPFHASFYLEIILKFRL